MGAERQDGRRTVTPRIVTDDVAGLTGFMRAVFDARGDSPDDAPAELSIGDSTIMVSDGGGLRPPMAAFLYVYVPDVEAAYARAMGAGARSIEAPHLTPYGDRRATVEDHWGDIWQIASRARQAAANVREAVGAERAVAIARLAGEWGDPILARDREYALGGCDILIAGDMAGLAAVSAEDRPVAELVAINAFQRLQGVGTALLRAVVQRYRADGFATLRLATTNDNIDALRFYQRRGFRLVALRPGATDAARRLKPEIPLFGDYGLPIRDEIDLALDLGDSGLI